MRVKYPVYMPKLTPETQEARKQQIIDAAVECFIKLGYSNASMADIIKESGLSSGSIYSHFKSKGEILRFAAEQNFKGFDALFDLGNYPKSTLISPRLIAQEFTARKAAAQKRPKLILQVWAEATHNAETEELVVRNLELIGSRLTEALLPWATEKAPQGVDARAYAERMGKVTFSLLQGHLLRSLVDKQGSTQELLEDMIALLPE